MRARRAAIPLSAASIAAAVVACGTWQSSAPVEPASYRVSRARVERSLGLLRRLAVVQLNQDAPPGCHPSMHDQARLAGVDEIVTKALVERKGYELVLPRSDPHGEAWSDADDTPLVRELLALASGSGAASGGATLRDALKRLRDSEQVDGLLVVHVRRTCARATTGLRPLLAIGSLGLSEVLVDPSLQDLVIDFSVFVLESQSAQVVWRHRRNYFVDRMDWLGSRKPWDTWDGLRKIVDAIEPAVPKLLVR
jgi:hypothetical protein